MKICDLRSGILAAAVAAASCGGGGSNNPPTTPTDPGGSVTVITITANGADKRDLTVPLGTRIRWVNNDTRQHEMSSDPHPEHNSCPELNSRLLSTGQVHETNNLVTVRTCGFHDHLNPDQANLKGTIRIQ